MKNVFILLSFLCVATNVYAHCEVPCGIYDDKARVQEIHEHTSTVLKAMNQVKELQAVDGEKNYNQIVRWINNKEKHAEEIQDIVHQYFMTQRIKPKSDDDEAYEKYVKELTLLHKILVHAMKSKQSLDTTHPEKMDALLHEFAASYFPDEAKGSQK